MALRRIIVNRPMFSTSLTLVVSSQSFAQTPGLIKKTPGNQVNPESGPTICLPPSGEYYFNRETAAAFAYYPSTDGFVTSKTSNQKNPAAAKNKKRADHLADTPSEDLTYSHPRQPSNHFWFDMASETEVVSSESKPDGSRSSDYHRVAKHNGKVVDEEHNRSSIPPPNKKKSNKRLSS